jgi:hypothetical protein
VIGTGSETTTIPGISSDLSQFRQIGLTGVVTTDQFGDLASDGGALYKQTAGIKAGAAVAMALSDPVLTENQRFGLKASVGGFDGATAFGISAAGVVARKIFTQYDSLTVSAAGGFGEAEVSGYSKQTFGVRGRFSLGGSGRRCCGWPMRGREETAGARRLALRGCGLRAWARILVSALALALAPGGQAATKAIPPASAAPQAQPAPANRPSAQLLVPNANGLAILIDNAVAALSQANVTGNYGVLHDLGSPDFQKLNSPQHLADVFAGLRQQNLNMTPLVLFQPRLLHPPAIDGKGILRIAGFYETQPLQVHFNLGFQAVEGAWRLYEIAVWAAQA